MNTILSVQLDSSFEDAVKQVTEALAEEGFGIITQIDVRSTVKQKLDLDFKNYMILGACNPTLAHRAISSNDDVGLLLPCNVIIYEDKNAAHVSTMKPTHMLGLIEDKEVCKVGKIAEEKLNNVFRKLSNN